MTDDFRPSSPRRRHERVEAAMPVRWAGRIGVTRNVSEGGIYFEMGSGAEVGSAISFDVELEAPCCQMRLRCNGQVVRMEQKGSRTGVAVRMLDSRLEAMTN